MTARLYRVEITGYPSGGPQTIYRYATRGYATLPTHATLPNVYMDARLQQSLLLERNLYGARRTYGDAEIGHGRCTLLNADGGLDFLREVGLDTQVVELREVSAANTNSESVVFRGYLESATFNDDSVELLIRDPSYSFDKPLQATKYAGTNALPAGVEGTANDIKGKPKPKLFGTVFNITPVLVNTSKLIYQFHDAALGTGWTFVGYDKRSVLTAGATYVSQADMEANAPAAGQYRVWPGGGMVRLGTAPAGQFTCDVVNPTAVVKGSAWYNVFAAVLACATAYTGGALTFGVDNKVSASVDWDVGFYWPDEINLYEALRQVARSVGAAFQVFPTTTPYGSVVPVTVCRLGDAPTQVLTLDKTSMRNVRLLQIADAERGIPPYRVLVSYKRNATVQSAADIAGASAADIAFCAAEYRTETGGGSAPGSMFPGAPEVSIATGLVSSTNAASLASFLWDVLGNPGMGRAYPRRLVACTVALELLDNIFTAVSFGGGGITPGLIPGVHGATVSYPRYGLGTPTATTILGYTLDVQRQEADLLLWS